MRSILTRDKTRYDKSMSKKRVDINSSEIGKNSMVGSIVSTGGTVRKAESIP